MASAESLKVQLHSSHQIRIRKKHSFGERHFATDSSNCDRWIWDDWTKWDIPEEPRQANT